MTSNQAGTPGPAPRPPGPAPAPAPRRWTAGRVIAVVLGSVLLLISFGFLAGGLALAVFSAQRDDDGFLMTDGEMISAPGHAIISEAFTIDTEVGVDVPDELLGDARLVVTPTGSKPVFVGIAPTVDVDAYLADVGHSTVHGLEGRKPRYDVVTGGAPSQSPTDVDFWTVSTSGTGVQRLTWEVQQGDWTVVVMNADGQAPVTAEAAIGAKVPALGAVTVVLFVLGGVLLLLALALLIGGIVSASRVRGGSPRYDQR